mgnify:CR=1 FL=1
MTKLIKTCWIDRYDHILTREEFEKADLINVFDVANSPALLEKYKVEEDKLWAFAKIWMEAAGMSQMVVFIHKDALHHKVPLSTTEESVYHQLDRVTIQEIQLNDKGWEVLQAVMRLGAREVLRATIQAGGWLLQTDQNMALFTQKMERAALQQLLDKTELHCLNESEEEDFWEEVEARVAAYEARRAKVAGAILGMAIGDGLGYPAEFLKREEIKGKLLENGFLHPNDAYIEVTDDTQMALAVAKALHWAQDAGLESLEVSLRKYFVAWLNDPANNRAPGMTCLASCERLEKGVPWLEATDKSSKGSGANMRVLPVGLWAPSGNLLAKVAQFQAAITHGHPTALVAAELTAVVVYQLLDGTTPDKLLPVLFEYATSQKMVYHEDYLQQLWDRPPFRTPQEFIQLGWEECLEKLKSVEKALLEDQAEVDPCTIGGAGWTAEESLATALYCFLKSPQDPLLVLQNAICTSGDSDSIACLAGGFVGAYLGLKALPVDKTQQVEYQEALWETIKWFA